MRTLTYIKRPSEMQLKMPQMVFFLFCQFSTFCPAESNTVSSCPVTLETSAM